MLMFDTGHTAAAYLRLRDLTYEVEGRRLLDVPDLAFSCSGISVVMGPNGAGKSLLLRLMHGLIQPTGGQVLCDERALTEQSRLSHALVLQSPVLLRRTAEANVRFVLKARGLPVARCDELLERVRLADRGKTPARRLSGGERQRLAIALALATDPKVLFLDEPTASLDPASVQMIEAILRRIVAAGVRVVLVTHDAMQARRLADDVVFMSAGQIVEHTPANEFFDAPKTRQARDYLEGRLTP